MTKQRSTKRALLMSALSLLLCVSMLVGTTYAWFTDEVVSGMNTITAGNLDVELKAGGNVVDANTTLFDDATLWEPGVVVYENLQIVNKGNLALKYQMSLNFGGENDLDGNKLSEVLKVAVLDKAIDPATTNRAEILAAAQAATNVGSLYNFFVAGELEKGESTTEKAVVVFWAPNANDVDNLYNANNGQTTSDGQPLHIKFGVNLVATQKMSESDSFGKDYDKDAWSKGFKVYNANDLQTAINNGEKNIIIMDDITTDETIIIPEGATVALDLNGKALSLAEDKKTTTYAINNLGNLVLRDTVGTGSVNSRGIYNGYAEDGNNVITATLVVENGVYNALGTNGGAAIFNYGKVTIHDGTFTSVGGYSLNNRSGAAMTVNNAVVTGGIFNNGDLIINNGNIKTNRGEYTHAIYSEGGSLEVNAGTFSGNGNEVINANKDVAIINGGTFQKVEKTSYLLAGSKMVINGGTFLAHESNPAGHPVRPDVTIKGGTFNYKPTNVASGYKAVENNGKYIVLPEEVAVAKNDAALKDAVNGGANGVFLGDGEYTMPSTSAAGVIEISGNKDAVLDMTMGAYMEAAVVTIKGVTIKTSTGKVNGNGSDYAALYTPNVTYIDCTFEGPMRVGRDGAKFINCTFTELGNDYVWTYGNDVSFESCTFNTAGKAILIYSDGGNEVATVSVKNCKFNSTQGAKAGAIANQNCAAIEIHNYGNGVNLTTAGNTFDSNFSGEWRIKTYEAGRTQVFVNGTEYTTIAIDGKTMTIDAEKNVTVNP